MVLSFANALNLDKFKFLSFGKGSVVLWCDASLRHINSLPNDKILDWPKLKVFTDDELNVTHKLIFFFFFFFLGGGGGKDG